ncbi:MAG: polyhydroxyalkanoate depolymerase [Alphaproteobacteria bacterium]
MLYQFYNMHLAAWEPMRAFAKAGEALFSNPWLPFSHTHSGRAAAAVCELVERTTRRYRKPAFGIEWVMVEGEEVAVSEECVLDTPFCRLLHFRRALARKPAKNSPRVLLVAPLSGHFATLLKGTLAALLEGHDVYLTDWRDASQVPLAEGRFDLDDYIDTIIGFFEKLGPAAHVVAVCQPSVPVMAAVSIMAAQDHPAQPSSMTLMGGPIDTRVNPTKVNELATGRPISWFENNVIARVPLGAPGAGRRVYPGVLQLTGFMSMNLDRHIGAHMKMYEHLVEGDGDSAAAHRKFYDEYMSVMDLPAEYYLQTITTVFQDHALPEGTMVSRGRKIDPGAIRKTALLTVEGEHDDISGIGQTKAAHALCSGLTEKMHAHYEQDSVGHYGIFNGRRWREQIMPRVADFIARFDK